MPLLMPLRHSSRRLRRHPRFHGRRPEGPHRRSVSLVALLLGFFFLVTGFALPASALPASSAPQAAPQAAPGGVRSITPNNVGTGAARSSARSQARLTLSDLTAVVSDSSGWRAQATIANTSSRTLPAGHLTAFVSPYTINSANAAQSWADGKQVFSTRLSLDEQQVPSLKPGQKHTVRLSAQKDSDVLKSFQTWGAKPVLLSYWNDEDGILARLQTFLTRSHAGLHASANPAITLTFALPLASTGWTSNPTAVNKIVTSSAASPQIGSLSDKQITRLEKLTQIASQNSSLQVIADPATLALMRQRAQRQEQSSNAATRSAAQDAAQMQVSRLQGVTQPYVFDIPASLSFSEKTWKEAGISMDDWSADASHEMLANDSTVAPTTEPSSASSSSPASSSQSAPTAESMIQPIAWEGAEPWATSSLSAAKHQGYSTVVSESALPLARGSNQQTGRIQITTENGPVTVLIAQHELSALASGQSTSSSAAAESGDAGRLARLAAQSSIYEAEQPYVARNLLVSFGRSASASLVQKILALLPSCDWIHTGKLSDLENGMTGTSLDKTGHRDVDSSFFLLSADGDDDDGYGSTAAENGASDSMRPGAPSAKARRASLKSALSAFASVRRSIERVEKTILDPKALEEKQSSENEKTDNPQNLAQQNAQQTAENHVTASQWLEKLRQAHRQLALLALTSPLPAGTTETASAKELSQKLLTAVRLTPPNHVNIFSQSARMPVTVKNNLPFAVRVRVDAASNFTATTITPSQTVRILANAETQANFTIHTIGASQTQITFSLSDRQGRRIGASRSAMVYSQLSLGDMSGYALIALAVVLGIAGLWRQFHVKKDPDQ